LNKYKADKTVLVKNFLCEQLEQISQQDYKIHVHLFVCLCQSGLRI